MSRKWIVIEEKKLEQLTGSLRAVKNLKSRVENPNSELYRFLSEKEEKFMHERDKQFMKLLRIYNDNPKRTIAVRCLMYLRVFPKRISELFKVVLREEAKH